MSEYKKHVDESWKDSVEQEKEVGQFPSEGQGEAPQKPLMEPETDASPVEKEAGFEVNFLNYISGLIFQAMIFLGDLPNPMAENKIEQNLPQAKFLIDTLLLLREKTKGNLNKEEDDLLNAAIYELQVKFVEHSSPENKIQTS